MHVFAGADLGEHGIRDENGPIRARTVERLVALGPDAVPALIPWLRGCEVQSDVAAEALASLGPRAAGASEALISAVELSPECAHWFQFALGRIGEAAQEAIARRLAVTRPEARLRLLEVLEKSEVAWGASAEAAVDSALEDSDARVRTTAAAAWAASDARRRRAWVSRSLLRGIGSPTTAHAISQVARGDAEAERAVGKALVGLLASEDDDSSLTAARLLGDLPAARWTSIPALRRAMRASDDAVFQDVAAESLLLLGDDDPLAIERVVNDPRPVVQVEAIADVADRMARGGIRGREAAFALVSRSWNDMSKAARLSVAGLLAVIVGSDPAVARERVEGLMAREEDADVKRALAALLESAGPASPR
jgi:hypothetical protein